MRTRFAIDIEPNRKTLWLIDTTDRAAMNKLQAQGWFVRSSETYGTLVRVELQERPNYIEEHTSRPREANARL